MNSITEHEEMIYRIRRMELYYDAVRAAADDAPSLLAQDSILRQMQRALSDYLCSGEWLSDYQADERGELPAGLKRGVLSQDGLYDLLRKDAELCREEHCLPKDSVCVEDAAEDGQ